MSTNTLKNLLQRVERLIDQQGEEAPCAAFIFTKEDVFDMDDDNNPVFSYSIDECHEILKQTEQDYDYIYEVVFDCINDEQEIIKKQRSQSNA